jgi:hypothetical protein
VKQRATVKITVTITPTSYAHMQMFLAKRTLNSGVNYSAVVGAIFGVLTMFGSIYLTGKMAWGVLLVAYCLLFYFAAAFAARMKFRRYLSQMGKCFYGDFTFENLPDGLHITGAYFTKVFRYDAFVETSFNKVQLLLLTGEVAGFHLPITEDNRSAVLDFNREVRTQMGIIAPAS